jgi:hypothetical protein
MVVGVGRGGVMTVDVEEEAVLQYQVSSAPPDVHSHKRDVTT